MWLFVVLVEFEVIVVSMMLVADTAQNSARICRDVGTAVRTVSCTPARLVPSLISLQNKKVNIIISQKGNNLGARAS